MDCSPPGSSVHGILKARTLGWLPFPPPGGLPDRGIKPPSLMSPALTGRFLTTSTTWEALQNSLPLRPPPCLPPQSSGSQRSSSSTMFGVCKKMTCILGFRLSLCPRGSTQTSCPWSRGLLCGVSPFLSTAPPGRVQNNQPRARPTPAFRGHRVIDGDRCS